MGAAEFLNAGKVLRDPRVAQHPADHTYLPKLYCTVKPVIRGSM